MTLQSKMFLEELSQIYLVMIYRLQYDVMWITSIFECVSAYISKRKNEIICTSTPKGTCKGSPFLPRTNETTRSSYRSFYGTRVYTLLICPIIILIGYLFTVDIGVTIREKLDVLST